MLPQKPRSVILFMAERMMKFLNVPHVFGRSKHHISVWCRFTFLSPISFLQIKFWLEFNFGHGYEEDPSGNGTFHLNMIVFLSPPASQAFPSPLLLHA